MTELDHKKHYLRYKDYQAEYRKKHAKEKRTYTKKYLTKLRMEVLELLGGKCLICGFSDPRALQVDHVNGGGTKERTMSRLFIKYVKEEILRKSNKYQLLCANCNWIKREENSEVGQKVVY